MVMVYCLSSLSLRSTVFGSNLSHGQGMIFGDVILPWHIPLACNDLSCPHLHISLMYIVSHMPEPDYYPCGSSLSWSHWQMYGIQLLLLGGYHARFNRRGCNADYRYLYRHRACPHRNQVLRSVAVWIHYRRGCYVFAGRAGGCAGDWFG